MPIGITFLKGWKLMYKGSGTGAYLTIEQTYRTDDFVPCGVWEISERNELALDRYEGYPRFYEKRIVKVLPEGYNEIFLKKVDALVYVMNENTEYALPSENYVHSCAEGYRDFGFNERMLYEALRRTRKELGI